MRKDYYTARYYKIIEKFLIHFGGRTDGFWNRSILCTINALKTCSVLIQSVSFSTLPFLSFVRDIANAMRGTKRTNYYIAWSISSSRVFFRCLLFMNSLFYYILTSFNVYRLMLFLFVCFPSLKFSFVDLLIHKILFKFFNTLG